MMTIRNMGDGAIYVSFPKRGYYGNKHTMPKDVEDWLIDYKIYPMKGYIAGVAAGIFLEGEDAVAFRLKFGV